MMFINNRLLNVKSCMVVVCFMWSFVLFCAGVCVCVCGGGGGGGLTGNLKRNQLHGAVVSSKGYLICHFVSHTTPFDTRSCDASTSPKRSTDRVRSHSTC